MASLLYKFKSLLQFGKNVLMGHMWLAVIVCPPMIYYMCV